HVELVARRHDDEEVHVAVLTGRPVGIGPEQDDLVGVELLGDGARVPADHAHRNIGAAIVALCGERKRRMSGGCHAAILPGRQPASPGGGSADAAEPSSFVSPTPPAGLRSRLRLELPEKSPRPRTPTSPKRKRAPGAEAPG